MPLHGSMDYGCISRYTNLFSTPKGWNSSFMGGWQKMANLKPLSYYSAYSERGAGQSSIEEQWRMAEVLVMAD
jgi:hypothetical protein